MESRREIVPVRLPNGQIVNIDVAALGGEEEVGFGEFSFDGVTGAIEEIARTITGTLQKVKPRKATVEFGVDVALESGKLTALLVKGTGTASLKITLEWGGAQVAAKGRG